METAEAKLKKFEDYYGKIDFTALWQIPKDIDRMVDALEENKLFQIYVREGILYITSEFDPYIVGLGFFKAKRKYKDAEQGEIVTINLN